MGIRDRVGIDEIVFLEAVDILDIVQRENGVSIYLAEDRDSIYVLGDDVTVDTITIVNGLAEEIA